MEPGDRPGTVTGVGQLALDPVGGRAGVGIGADDQAVRPRRIRTGARPPRPCRAGGRRPRPGPGPIERGEREPRRGRGRGATTSAVASRQPSSTTIVSKRWRPIVWAARARRQRGDRLLFVTGRDDDDAGQLHGAPFAIRSRPALVVGVGLVGEHPDQAVHRAPNQVVKLSARAGLEPDLIEPVAPGGVLQRALADRRPEARDLVPGRRCAGGGRARRSRPGLARRPSVRRAADGRRRDSRRHRCLRRPARRARWCASRYRWRWRPRIRASAGGPANSVRGATPVAITTRSPDRRCVPACTSRPAARAFDRRRPRRPGPA